MPRNKNQKHYHWDIDDPYQLTIPAKRKAQLVKVAMGLNLAAAVTFLINTGYDQLVSDGLFTPSPSNSLGNERESGTENSQAA